MPRITAFPMRRALLFLTLALVLTGCSKQARPLIGISCGWDEARTSVKNTYIDAVRLAGGIPVLVPLVRDSLLAEDLVGKLDALIMSGGEDIDPLYFGEEHLEELGEVNAPRDTSDVLLIKIALRQGKPLLGICRGEQVINVVLGGTLYQDIPSQIPESELKHRQEEEAAVATQAIRINEGSRLHKILEADTLGVNSFHHQAVKDLAPGLVITARTEDGVVEAYEGIPDALDLYGKPLKDRILCVQFHPEAFAQAGDPTFLRIFQDLVSRSR